MKHILIAAAFSLALVGPAFAFHCPADMAKIDAALAQSPELSAEQLAEVTQRRADGEALHNGGQHQEAVDTLAEAMKILGIE